MKRLLIAFVSLASVVALLAVVKAAQIKELMGMSHAMPPTAVTTLKASPEVWHPMINAVGTLTPVRGVTLSSELEGAVTKIAVENGAAVKEGDLLIELDTADERAQLGAAQARAELARLQLDRARELLRQNTISQAEVDNANAQFNQTQADMKRVEVAIAKKSIRAPFSGRVGIRMVNLGQFVTRGTPLIPLQQLDPIYADFKVPQRQLPALAVGQEVSVTVDAFPDHEFVAKVTAISPLVDASTRNVSVQAELSNPKEVLRAGMFVRVAVTLPVDEEVVVVPSTAISYASYGNSIYVVEDITGEDGSTYLGVRQQPVTLGRKRGDMVSVLTGLAGDETVVTSGVFKLRNKMAIFVNNVAQPSASETPTPDNT